MVMRLTSSATGRFVLVLLPVLTVVVGVQSVGLLVQRSGDRAAEARVTLARDIERIRYYDELLTMSVRLAASTGDRSYVERYQEAVPKLDQVIAEAFTVVPDQAATEALRTTARANDALLALEEESFRLLAAGDRTGAYAVVSNATYLQLKDEYSGGMAVAFERLRLASARQRTQAAHRQLLSLALGAGAALLLTSLWIAANRRLRRSQDDIAMERRLRFELQSLTDRLAHDSRHDALTGLANRIAFDETLRRVLARRRPAGRGPAVLLLDLDAFKAVNDQYGHQVGDRLLSVTADRVRAQVRESDVVARLGGDEFAVVVEETDVGGALVLGERITAAVRQVAELGDVHVTPGVSVGIYIPDLTVDAEQALVCADSAMYAAKLAGGGHQLFDPERHNKFIERYRLELDLRAAARAGELVLHYQPIVDLATGRSVAAEALLRWNHPTRGLLYPDAFIGVAEESGAIVELGRWVLAQSCADARLILTGIPDHRPFTVAVNISRRQLTSDTLVDDVSEALQVNELAPEGLALEVAETALMSEGDDMIGMLHKLKALGVELALDDFGTGWSSLAQLGRMPVDVLKIDRVLIAGIASGEREWALATAVIRFGRSVEKRTLAEGVEDPGQLAHLRSMGCDLGQGDLFARPMPLPELIDHLAEQR